MQHPKVVISNQDRKIPTSPFTNNNLSDFVSIANAAYARQEEKERVEQERLKLEDAVDRQLSRSVQTQHVKFPQVDRLDLSTTIGPAITGIFPGKFAVVKAFIDSRF